MQLALISFLIVVAALLGFGLHRAGRTGQALERRALAAERLAAARGRCLSLAAAELRGVGLSLSAGGAAGLPERVLGLADNLSNMARAPEAKALREQPSALGPLVDAAVAVVAAQIRPGIRHWKVDPALRALTVRADRRALEGAVAALLRRAAAHSRDGDVIALRHVVASETLAIVIEDEGDGLTAADVAPDAVAPPGGTRGLDLGLSLARALAAAHGGDIRLESAPGIGARVWLTLPRERLLEAA